MNSITTIRPELDRLNKEVNESVYLSKPLHVEFIVIEWMINSVFKFHNILAQQIKRCRRMMKYHHIVKVPLTYHMYNGSMITRNPK